MKDVLVIGFGNSLRSDDGAGIAAAIRIAEMWPGTATLVCHQLGPELAETIAAYKAIVFIDASATATEPLLETLTPVESQSMGDMHAYGPQRLINLSKALYAPIWKSVLVLHIPASSIEFGERRSEETDHYIVHGIEMLKHALTNAQKVPQG